MLRKEFSKADLDLLAYLTGTQPDSDQTWLEFCRERGFTVEDMMSGFEWHQRRSKTIDHDPQSAPIAQVRRLG